MTRMLRKPEVGKILAELDSIDETSLGSLLAFMRTYNLRFGPATTTAQRSVYRNLYPIMAQARDRILKEAGVGLRTSNPRPDGRHAVDFFQGLHLEHLDRRSGDDRTSP